MSSTKADVSDKKFPPADIDGELNPGKQKSFEVDPISTKVETTKEIKKEEAEATRKKNEREKKGAMQTLKSAIMVSGIVVALAGAVFAITKKLREKSG
ncbi:putative Transmembrane protein [Quillaja saponaria]|uniref:Transmembrane protein n=1 Tax=Quillaja saponaria TaxID=32244 RepID=A0AAD7PYJ4_QUISA|nr:putative Transmembrane protein [Quillaja saponaria]